MQRDCNEILIQLECWYSRENGQYLLEETRAATRALLDTAFGYHILQLGVGGERPLCADSPINHQLVCSRRSGKGINLVATPEELPLESDSVDTVIAHHCLEFASNPHQVLREIQRVLTPQGQLLVVGFNPYSLFGCNTQIRGLLRDPLWSQHRPVGEHRLTDWLHLLGCEVLGTRRLYTLPPLGHERLRGVLANCDHWLGQYNLPLGGVYILHARKQTAGLNRPRRPLLAGKKRLIGLVPNPAPVPTPTPRSGYHRTAISQQKGSLAA